VSGSPCVRCDDSSFVGFSFIRSNGIFPAARWARSRWMRPDAGMLSSLVASIIV